jgi:hypothetical protein
VLVHRCAVTSPPRPNPNLSTLPQPSIVSGGVVPVDGSWDTTRPGPIDGNNLAATSATRAGYFSESLGNTSVTINGRQTGEVLFPGRTMRHPECCLASRIRLPHAAVFTSLRPPDVKWASRTLAPHGILSSRSCLVAKDLSIAVANSPMPPGTFRAPVTWRAAAPRTSTP